MWFDSHTHFDRFVEQDRLDALLEKAMDAKVSQMLAVGGSEAANTLSCNLANKFPDMIYASAGYDRDMINSEYNLVKLEQQVLDPKVCAIGETGLDYFHNQNNKKEQKQLFGENLELAYRYKKPVIVHSRAADGDTLAMLKEHSSRMSICPGVLHCFTLDKSCATQLLDMGYMISFSGIVTFANANDLRNIVSYIPSDKLLIETDAPYLAPVPNRGKENEPAFLVDTGLKIAELRGCLVEEVAEITTENAIHMFGLEKRSHYD